jgi:hypothetical protein
MVFPQTSECTLGSFQLERKVFHSDEEKVLPLGERRLTCQGSTPKFAKIISSKFARMGALVLSRIY